jgi:hypothetical protein
MFTELHKIATVSLGYKSLQNDFFYLNKATISTYGIEKKFLVPMLTLKDLDPGEYEQNLSPSLWLFACREKRADLRGTGLSRSLAACCSLRFEAVTDVKTRDRKIAGENRRVLSHDEICL